jgi:voltage-gated potassium channel
VTERASEWNGIATIKPNPVSVFSVSSVLSVSKLLPFSNFLGCELEVITQLRRRTLRLMSGMGSSMQRGRRHKFRTIVLYIRALLYVFRWELCILGVAVLFGGLLYHITPHDELNGATPDMLTSLFGAWSAMLGQPILSPPETWYLTVLCTTYTVLGFVVIGQGVVRLALMLSSRREGEAEWMKVAASTYRDHVVICGLGHLGYRVLEQFMASDVSVVAIELDPQGRFLAQARNHGVPVLIHDMKDDKALLDAGVPVARAIVIATNDDMANLEVALDARRMNPKIRVMMRLYDQQIAKKIADAFAVDVAFSSSALAAPIVAAMALQTKVISTFTIAGVDHVTSEITVDARSADVGKTVAEFEALFKARVLAQTTPGAGTQSPPALDARVKAGDILIVHAAAAQITAISAASKAAQT